LSPESSAPACSACNAACTDQQQCACGKPLTAVLGESYQRLSRLRGGGLNRKPWACTATGASSRLSSNARSSAAQRRCAVMPNMSCARAGALTGDERAKRDCVDACNRACAGTFTWLALRPQSNGPETAHQQTRLCNPSMSLNKATDADDPGAPSHGADAPGGGSLSGQVLWVRPEGGFLGR